MGDREGEDEVGAGIWREMKGWKRKGGMGMGLYGAIQAGS